MKNTNLKIKGIQELNIAELKEIQGGFIITIAVGIAIGVSFITGVGIGVALYGVTHQN